MKEFLLIGICIVQVRWAICQNTVGLISQQVEQVYPGYNLVFPHNQANVFLLDNCGQIVHMWEDEAMWRPGNAVYLTEEGNLIKAKRGQASINDPIWAGGGGEIVEIRDWNNQLLWEFRQNNTTARLHHDIAPMPNGNILMISWEVKTLEESLLAGRDPEKIAQGELWPDYLLEINPNSNEIVWEWHAWDHLVQDFDSTQENFGVVSEHPERIDINFDNRNGHPDWMHANSVDYNPVLDQVLLSVPYFDEVWIIDHNTSTEEAAGPKGDLLYRWGNPQTYRQGTEEDQQLFFPHDIDWVDPFATPDDSLFGQLSVFNNRVSTRHSTGNLFTPLFDEASQSYRLSDSVFLPLDYDRTFVHPVDSSEIFSAILSSLQMLPNGNGLIMAGRWGRAFEINVEDEIVWEYIIPLKSGSPASQGDTLVIDDNLTFRLERYGLDFVGFEGKDLSPKGYWELAPNEDFCTMTVSHTPSITPEFYFYPNPSEGFLFVQTSDFTKKDFLIFDLMGRVLKKGSINPGLNEISIPEFNPGIYWLHIEGLDKQSFVVRKKH